jgi:hypothetical protein
VLGRIDGPDRFEQVWARGNFLAWSFHPGDGNRVDQIIARIPDS